MPFVPFFGGYQVRYNGCPLFCPWPLFKGSPSDPGPPLCKLRKRIGLSSAMHLRNFDVELFFGADQGGGRGFKGLLLATMRISQLRCRRGPCSEDSTPRSQRDPLKRRPQNYPSSSPETVTTLRVRKLQAHPNRKWQGTSWWKSWGENSCFADHCAQNDFSGCDLLCVSCWGGPSRKYIATKTDFS